MILSRCEVLEQRRITESIFCMRLKAESIAREASPGQFVHIKVSSGIEPLLRRPFSIHRVHRSEGQIELLYRIVGKGTTMMGLAGKETVFDVMGPLGKGFVLEKSFTRAIIVAGGMGIAPAFFLMDELIRDEKKVILLWGAQTGDEIFDVDDWVRRGVEVYTATEDGSHGLCGLVTDLLGETFQRLDGVKDAQGFVCGPKSMLRCVQDLCRGTPFGWQVSVEERMACGLGVCMGCAVKLSSGGYRVACTDGPVFNLDEVVFDG